MAKRRAAERVDSFRTVRAGLRPDPHCLDAAPAGMMQRSHRESVVHFINEVPNSPRLRQPPPPSTPAPVRAPTAFHTRRGPPPRCARTSRSSSARPAAP